MGDPQSPCLKTCWNIWSRLVIHDLDDMGLKPQWLRKPLTIDHWMSTCSPAAYFERWRGWRRLQSSFYGQNPKRNHLKDQHVWTKNTEHVMNVTYIHIYIHFSLSLSRSLSLSPSVAMQVQNQRPIILFRIYSISASISSTDILLQEWRLLKRNSKLIK